MTKLIGQSPNQVPTNADLGTMAYQDKDYLDVGEVHSDNHAIVSTNSSNAFSVTTNASSNVALSIGGSSTINGVTSGAQSFYIMNVARDSGSGKSAYFNGNVGFPNGYGIDFSASEGSGASSSVLNDYEEGAWTPSYGASTTNPTVSYNTQVGYYTKVGRLVSVYCQLVTNSVSGGSGHLSVTGLPFTAASGVAYASATIGFNYNWNTPPHYLGVQGSTTQLVLYSDATSNTTSEPSHLKASDTSYLYFMASYYT